MELTEISSTEIPPTLDNGKEATARGQRLQQKRSILLILITYFIKI
jgi:hypothetical protein